MDSAPAILTIGHSRHTLERFLALLKGAQVACLADIRSAPVSRFSPQFNRAALLTSLAAEGIAYFFLGRELGGRPERAEMYTEGVVDYEKMAASPEFRAGLAQLKEAAEQRRVAVMCAEADPLDCHRFPLVARALAGEGIDLGHILADGSIIAQAEAEDMLLAREGLAEPDLLLKPRAMRLAEAYRSRSRRAAYALTSRARRDDHPSF